MNGLLKIAKLVGVNIGEVSVQTQEDIETILRNHQKYDDYKEVLDFVQASGRKSIAEFMFKAQKVVVAYVKAQPFYEAVQTQLLKQQLLDLRKTLQFQQVNAYATHDNDGKTFVSFDIQAANFSCVKLISNGAITGTWPEFFKKILPNDTRSNSKRNMEKQTAGLTLDIPLCL